MQDFTRVCLIQKDFKGVYILLRLLSYLVDCLFQYGIHCDFYKEVRCTLFCNKFFRPLDALAINSFATLFAWCKLSLIQIPIGVFF
jgi:hypothetical protein